MSKSQSIERRIEMVLNISYRNLVIFKTRQVTMVVPCQELTPVAINNSILPL